MRKRRFRTGLFTVLFGILFFGMTSSADVDKLSISQIVQDGNDVYLYVSALDGDGKPAVESVSAEQFSVSIDKGQPLTVTDAAVFQSLNQGVSYIFCVDISKSVTEEEMTEIRSSISSFISGMSANDYAEIITIGTDISFACYATQDRNTLNNAVAGIQRTANDTYLYKGISSALESKRKSVDIMPERAAIILFTDGMDDSDGAASEEQVLVDIAETRIPVYVVGLKGKDASANLNSVGQIARQSGGSVFSYNDMSVSEAVNTIRDIMNSTTQLHVQPQEESFGAQNLIWNVTYTSNGYSVSSSSYVYSLGMDNVSLAPETEETQPVTEPEEIPVETEPETEPEKTFFEKAADFARENFIICIASVVILIALIIILVIFLQKNRSKDAEIEMEDFPIPDSENYGERTLAESVDIDSEETQWEESNSYSDDDGETVDGSYDSSGGLRLEFEITFNGQTKTVKHVLRDQLVLGRGKECDVDVVLHSDSEERKQTSRKHAFIIERPDGLYVKDNSRNKTYLNGMEVIGEMALRDEDVLQMGKATVKIKIAGY